MKLKNYNTYKPCKINWCRMIPDHWQQAQLRICIDFATNGLSCNQKDQSLTTVAVSRIETISEGKFNFEKIGYIEKSDADPRRLIKKGDLAFSNINSLSMIGNCAILESEEEIYAGMNLLHIRPKQTVEPKWLYWLMRSNSFRSDVESNSKPAINQASIPQSKLVSIQIPIPHNKLEQSKIARFLDREIAKIDALIAEQERLIELLQEKRQAVISHAVTKGLNPNAPMKDSGVEWLGEVPEHWAIGPVKRFLSSMNYKRVPLSSEERSTRQGNYPYYGASGIIDSVDDFLFNESLVLVSEDGANLLMRSTPIAFEAHGEYWVNNHAHILRPNDGLTLFWSERIECVKIAPFITGSAQPKLTAEALLNLTISCPLEIEEKRAIEEAIKSVRLKLDPLIKTAESAVKLLRERRSALISAAVTGQIDVRGLSSQEELA